MMYINRGVTDECGIFQSILVLCHSVPISGLIFCHLLFWNRMNGSLAIMTRFSGPQILISDKLKDQSCSVTDSMHKEAPRRSGSKPIPTIACK